MATNLIVRNVEPEIVKSLKEQAARNGRSAEAEHRAILEAALRRPRKRSFYRSPGRNAECRLGFGFRIQTGLNRLAMYLIDTNVLSERRKGRKADPGVAEFFRRAKEEVFRAGAGGWRNRRWHRAFAATRRSSAGAASGEMVPVGTR